MSVVVYSGIPNRVGDIDVAVLRFGLGRVRLVVVSTDGAEACLTVSKGEAPDELRGWRVETVYPDTRDAAGPPGQKVPVLLLSRP